MKWRYALSMIFMVGMVISCGRAQDHQPAQTGQHARSFTGEITKAVGLEYLLFLPEGYGEQTRQKWPLILFLHGAGERGDDLDLVKVHGIPKIVETDPAFPFIAVSPQCPADSWWTEHLDDLAALLDNVIAAHNVNTNQIYLTGLSMGGYGTWDLALAQPERFAAIVPICGGGRPYLARRLKDLPVWVFHGAKDTVVPPEESEQMVAAIKRAGGSPRLTIYPDAGHDSWTETYANPELYTWLLEQEKEATGR